MKNKILKVLFTISCLLLVSGFAISCDHSTPEDPDNNSNPNVPSEPESVTVTFIKEDQTVISSVSIEEDSNGNFVLNYDTANFEPDTGYKYLKCVDAYDLEVVFGQTQVYSDCKITVLFEPISYTIVFENDDESVTGELPLPVSAKYDQEITLPGNFLTKSDSTNAVGWFLKGDSAKNYTSSQVVKNLTSEDGATVTLLPYFTDKDYTITFKDCSKTTNFYINNGQTISSIPACAYKSWYTCSGYYDESDSTKTIIDFSTYTYTKSATFIALYVPETFKVTFVNEKGAAPAVKEITADDGKFDFEEEGGLYTPELTGYTFDGWDNGYKTITYLQVGDTVTEDITLTAEWTAKTCKLFFYNTSDASSYSSSMSVKFDETVTLPKWSNQRSGYKFLGWALESDKTTKVYDDQAEFTWNASTYDLYANGPINFYAIWKAPSVTITFAEPVAETDIKVKLDEDNNCLTAALEGVSTFNWYIDDVQQSGTSASFAYKSITTGFHTFMVTATKDSKTYSITGFINKLN